MIYDDDLDSSWEVLSKEVDSLIQNEQFYSAEIVLSLFQSSLLSTSSSSKFNNSSANLEISFELAEKYGDVIFKQNNYKRALHYYHQSWQTRKLFINSSSNLMKSPSNMKLSVMVIDEIDARIKYKESNCHLLLNDNSTALTELESIPIKLRTIAINMKLGKLYKATNLRKQAISVYQEVIKANPLMIEAIEALINLCETKNDIVSLLDDTLRNKSIEILFQNGWLHEYINGLIYKKLGDYSKTENKLQLILKSFPNNVHILTHLAINAMLSIKYEQSYNYYKQIRRIDSLVTKDMDSLAMMLHYREDSLELNKLGHEMLAITNDSPIGWIVVSLYCDLKNETEKAISFIDKAINLNVKYPLSFIIKGKFLLSQEQLKQATVAFFQANLIEKDLITLSCKYFMIHSLLFFYLFFSLF